MIMLIMMTMIYSKERMDERTKKLHFERVKKNEEVERKKKVTTQRCVDEDLIRKEKNHQRCSDIMKM